VFNDSLVNLTRGILERVFYVKYDQVHTTPVQASDEVFNGKYFCDFRRQVVYGFGVTTPISMEKFVESHVGRKRTIYENARKSLGIDSLNKRDAELEVFIKAVEKTNVSAKPDPIPRIISPRGPRYGISLGVYMKPVEHRIYKRIGKVFGAPTVAKGMNVEQVAEVLWDGWNHFNRPVAVGLDATRFDQHVGVAALKYEHSFYNVIYKSNYLDHLLKQQLRNKAKGYVGDGKVKYVVDGGRMSGDMNTSLGNCIMMCAMIYVRSKNVNVKIRLLNNGDDCVIIMEQSDLSAFVQGLIEEFHTYGFHIVVEEPVYDFEKISFCQMQPVFDGSKHVMCRDPGLAFAKDAFCVRSVTTIKEMREWIGSVGKGGLSIAAKLPMFQEFYSMFVRNSYGECRKDISDIGGLYYWNNNMDRKVSRITPEARSSFYFAFGVSPSMQIEFERYMRTYKLLNQTPKMEGFVEVPEFRWCKMGSANVIAQNCDFSAKQNAKRSHGARPEDGYADVRSRNWPVSHTPIKMPKPKSSSTMKKNTPNSNNNNNKNKNPQRQIVYVDRPMSQPKVSTLGRIGQLAGDGISKFFGLGAYKLSKNSLYSNVTGSQVPAMHSSSESIVFRHREFLCDISSSSAFTNQFDSGINPGLAGGFPYLSSIAQNFQEYKFRGLIYQFKSTSADALNSTNTALGTISMVCQYRSDAPLPNTKVDLLNEMWSADAKPSESFILPIECDPKENPLSIQYIRSGSLSLTQDPKFYDLGHIAVYSNGSQATAVVGELWVTYEVELFKPVLSSGGGDFSAPFTHWMSTSYSNAKPLGTATSGVANGAFYTNNLQMTASRLLGVTSSLTIPNAQAGSVFMFQMLWIGDSTACVAPSQTFTNGTAYLLIGNPVDSYGEADNATTTNSRYFITYFVKVTNNDDLVLALGAVGTLPANGVSFDLFVTQIPSNAI